MNRPLATDDSTPSRGAMMLTPTSQVRTTQATLIAVIVSALSLGGMIASFRNDIANQAREMTIIKQDTDRLMRVVFFNESRDLLSNSKTNPKATP